jgi:anti-sigma regulatory factor (Ser/Thr protein kinase)
MADQAPQPMTAPPAPAHDTPHAGGRLVLNVTSDPANLAPVRRACEAFCRAQGLDDGAINDIGLCVNEAMANITRHAYDGATDKPVVITAEAIRGDDEDGRPGVRITLRDWGSGVNPLAQAPRERDPMRPGGLGLVCLRQLLDDARFEPQANGGMLLTMLKRKGSAVRVQGSGNDCPPSPPNPEP